MKIKQIYTSPYIRVICLKLEKGFAASADDNEGVKTIDGEWDD